MQGQPLPRVKKGDVYTADLQNEMVDEIERQGKLHVGEGLSGTTTAAGVTVADDPPDWMYARITAVSGDKFSWTEQISTPGGGWTSGPRSGTPSSDPAYEANGHTSITLPIETVMRRARATGEWVFFANVCSG
jgi:hypothetical protein